MPLHADVSFDKEGVSIQALRGAVCGVSYTRKPQDIGSRMDMEARPTALNQELEPAILCVTDKKTDITGVYTLDGRLKAKGKADDILRSLQGMSGSRPVTDKSCTILFSQKFSRSSV